MSLSTYYHTIKHLKAEQLYYQIYYKLCAKLRKISGKKPDYTFYKKGIPILFSAFPDKSVSYKCGGTFEFLNVRHCFRGAWDDGAFSDLWRYNLNYMDFILQPLLPVAEGLRWIERFIDDVSRNKTATDPYPISLRGINWIKFVSLYRDELTDAQIKKIDTSLYSQYKILSGHTERHLLANHYLENGFSLLFAAVYFCDTAFWKKAKRIVEAQLKEQIMDDGAHYELSPMYHCIILERLLDCYNLLCSVSGSLFDNLVEFRELLGEKARHMLAWMDAIVTSGDEIPLFNDSAYGVALLPSQLRKYAEALELKWECGTLGDSGYRRVVRANYEAIFDMAQPGVSYNLGHSHADSSTFLLWANGRELLVEAGTSTYAAGERRCYERSTLAHNTVTINKENSSKVWGAFRCAQRARTVIKEDGPECFALWHNGYEDKGIECHRCFVCKDSTFEVIDTVIGNTNAVAEAHFHLSPEVKVLSVEADRVVTDRAVFVFKGHNSIHLLKEEIAKEYNVLQPTVCIDVCFSGKLHTKVEDFR